MISTASVLPAVSVKFPLLIIPALLPGASVPPLLTVTGPTLPVPPRVAVLLTLIALAGERLPVTRSTPALMVVAPV